MILTYVERRTILIFENSMKERVDIMTDFEKLLANPVAYRILQHVVANRSATTLEIADAMPDISRATVYRYCKRMADNEILDVISEDKIRGQTCRTYVLRKVTIAGDETTNNYMAATLLFLRMVHKKYDTYFSMPGIDTKRDKLFMISPDLVLDDQTYAELCDRLKTLVLEYAELKPNQDSRIRNLFLMSAPDESWEVI